MWIGRSGPVARSLRSLDLFRSDFLSWGLLKSIIYSTAIGSIEELKNRITAEISLTCPNSLPHALNNTKLRLNYMMRLDGVHIENNMNQ